MAVFSEKEGWQIFLGTGSSTYYRNSSWDENLDLFGWKIGWKAAMAFVM
jgi:hypothetical protein